MPARLFVFVGHPRSASLSHGLADAYQRGAEAQGAEVRRMNLSDMQFDPDLTEGYHARKTLEPCLEEWRENLSWANHTCWAYPQWWGGMPAKMKGVIDRCFLPGRKFGGRLCRKLRQLHALGALLPHLARQYLHVL